MTAEVRKRTRREHSAAFKAEVVRACAEPGVSVAGVALAHGLNANLVRSWLRAHGVVPPSRRTAVAVAVAVPAQHEPVAEFVPVAVSTPRPAPLPPPDIRIDLRRGATAATVTWPLAAADSCGAWLREWLR